MVTGIHCVTFAFFDTQGRLDRGAMRAQAEAVAAMGVDGFVTLGLATEVGKLSLAERLQLIDWAAEDAHSLPLSVTVTGNSVDEQRQVLRAAEAVGAALAILQPPLSGSWSASECIDFFSAVGAHAGIALAVQNAPQYLGRALSADHMMRLRERLPQLSHVKAETAAVDLAAFIAEMGPGITVLNGRGGLEMIDSLEAGAEGFVVAPDVAPGVLACWRAWRQSDRVAAHAAYGAFLPGAVFGMQSLEHLACYGKRVFARRAGIAVHDRAPALRPSAFGLALVEAHAVGTAG